MIEIYSFIFIFFLSGELILSVSFFSSQLPEERKVDLLKALAEVSPCTTPQDSRQILPSIVQLLKVNIFVKIENIII